jgi:hypothetical protein
MSRLITAAAFVLLLVPSLSAQDAATWRFLGDTAGAPPGCSASAAIATINLWFQSYNTADSLGLERAMAVQRRGGWVFSNGHFTAQDPFVRIQSLPDLLRYTRARARRHEHLALTAVHFYGWKGRTLSFMPFYSRSASDLGPTPLPGTGKVVYACGQGLFKFNLAPKPS